MADIKKAFPLSEDGLSLNDEILIFHGSVDPSSVNQGNITVIPQGSFYIRTTGEIWQKTNVKDLDWRRLSNPNDILIDINGNIIIENASNIVFK